MVRIFQNNATVNWTTVCTNDFTAFPSTRHGGESDDLRMANLEIGGGAHVFVAKDAKIESVKMDEHSTINLFGRSLTVKRAKLGENRLAPGRYVASSSAVAGFVVDTAEGAGGTLVVTGGGFSISIR